MMTAQTPDILIHRGAELDLCATPLEPYLARLPKARRPDFVATSTALWRGYVATWEIVAGRLYLVALKGVVRAGEDFQEVDLATALPWRRDPILATWVTDWLRCPEGRLRAYRHAAFQSVYERDREFDVVGGIVERELVIHNPPAPLVYEILPDGERVFRGERSFLRSGSMMRAFDPDDRAEDDPFLGDAPIEPWRLWGDANWGFEGDEGYEILAMTNGLHHLNPKR